MTERKIKIKNYLSAVNYKIHEGYEYLWKCFGDNVYSLEYFEEDIFSCSCVFDTKTSNVYVLEFWNYKTGQCFRWIDSSKEQDYINECNKRNLKFEEAIDGKNFVQCNSNSILNLISDSVGVDKKENIEINLTEKETFELMKRAHELDITFNELVEDILWEAIEKNESGVETKEIEKISTKSKRSKKARKVVEK